MSTQMLPFSPKPMALRSATVSDFNSALSAGTSAGGFPSCSIKGKVFHIVKGGVRTLITKPGEDDPAASIEVVLVAANPNQSRVYYSGGYVEGSEGKPTCYSNNGKTPEEDSLEKQAKSCAACVHSQYGSKVSESGVKGWACANSRRLAIAPVGQLNDPMLLRVPGASLKALTQYAKDLDVQGYPFNEVVTKLGFDYSVAHPALTFKAIGVLPGAAAAEAVRQASTDVVMQILGIKPGQDSSPTIPVPASVAALPKKIAAPVEVVEEPEAAHVPVKVKPKAKVVVVEAEMAETMDDMLTDVNFDD